MKNGDTPDPRIISTGTLGGIDIQEIKGQRWEYVLAFSFFLGCLGIDRFITGSWKLGILKLITIGGFGIWYLVDLVLIGTENFKDKDGNYIVRYAEERQALSRNSSKDSASSVAKALEEFNDLKLKGIITDQEFKEKKAELLGK